MKLLITGDQGFFGKNLVLALSEARTHSVAGFNRANDFVDLPKQLDDVDVIIHLAGENRPHDEADFSRVNHGLTLALCEAAAGKLSPPAIFYASSTQAGLDNAYGRSKRAAEEELISYASQTGAAIGIVRFPNLFGKWCRPNYNSAVATFCHNIALGLPITVNDPDAPLNLMHIDDAVELVKGWLAHLPGGVQAIAPTPVYQTTVGYVAARLKDFANSRKTLLLGGVGTGLDRALYSTYVSHLPHNSFAYSVPIHGDERGDFVEMLRTPESGQFSYFTAGPGVTRGGHYHHTKTERFLVIQGNALFRFRHLLTNEIVTLQTRGGDARIVETIPGWSHDITNAGDDMLIVMLWANELFDRERPDTIACEVAP